LYRHFHEAAEKVEPMGWAVLHELRARIEDTYTGWFLPQFGTAWARVIEGEGGLLSQWTAAGMPNQHRFFDIQVAPLLAAGAKRVFVVISDAFRYEAAEELVQQLNSKSRFKAGLSSHAWACCRATPRWGWRRCCRITRLAYKANSNLDVLADGQPWCRRWSSATRTWRSMRALASRPTSCWPWGRTRVGRWCAIAG
jgi:hypothetical protein